MDRGRLIARHLFVDDRFIAEREALRTVLGEPVMCPKNPVIRADRPSTEMAGRCAIDYDGTRIGMLYMIRNLAVPHRVHYCVPRWDRARPRA